MTTTELKKYLKSQKVETWFDLGLFMDKFKEERKPFKMKGGLSKFKNDIAKKGVGFVTFYYSVDGITIEVEKYCKAFKMLFPKMPIHYIGGEFKAESVTLVGEDVTKHSIPEIDGFDHWPLYDQFFKAKLERGSQAYNDLIGEFWKDIMSVTEKLSKTVEKNNIGLLYLVNTNSNPGNVSLAVATVLVSELMGIPVINNNHDFYWEGGNRPVDIAEHGVGTGPRDIFFTNSHIGEFFSIIETVYPWQSKSWLTTNINRAQVHHVVKKNGHNPANVKLLGTAVDTAMLRPQNKRENINAFLQVGEMLSGYKDQLPVQEIKTFIKELGDNPAPVLLSKIPREDFDFTNNNIVFLQPTRIIARKQIELDFKLVGKLFENREFRKKFEENPQLSLTVLITGPIPLGQQSYFQDVLADFQKMVNKLKPNAQGRVLLGLLFSEFDKARFLERHENPLGIPQLYNIASLILLPSLTEGRGLPIIEAAACGTPIFCRRYEPRDVYEEVIGKHLSEENRLHVLEFKESKLPNKLVKKILNSIFYPQEILTDVVHNKKVIQRRYSLDSLRASFDEFLEALHLQLTQDDGEYGHVKDLFSEYAGYVNYTNPDLKKIINKNTRHYLPGYGRIGFMMYLKSLIDPSFFRTEEQINRGMLFGYAKGVLATHPNPELIDKEKLHEFFNTIDKLFEFHEGEYEIRHDHSLAYRHRNTRIYPLREYTFHELTGLVNMIYDRLIDPPRGKELEQAPHFFTDWNLALMQLTNSHSLGIDDRALLIDHLKDDVPRAYFPGEYINYEIEQFVLQPLRAILKLSIETELTEEILNNRADELPKAYVFVHERQADTWLKNYRTSDYLGSSSGKELLLLYRFGVVKVVKTKQFTVGMHFPQMGAGALKVLKELKSKRGFIIANGEHAAMMTDILDIDHFHIGRVNHEMTAQIMGIGKGEGFIQFVPAGVRTTLAYPTPIQTAKDFDRAIKSKSFAKLVEHLGEAEAFSRMRTDAEENGSPIKKFIADQLQALRKTAKSDPVKSSFVGGVYADGLPWSGVMAEIETQGDTRWEFAAYTSIEDPKPVTELVTDFEKKNKKSPVISWNGGYILNGELVGKLGLPTTYIGSPLGLLVIKGKVVCPPLFNKPAFVIKEGGEIQIKKVNLDEGMEVQGLIFESKYCNKHSDSSPCYYNLNYSKKDIKGDGNVIVRLAGNTVKEVINTKKGEKVKLIPVGITLSIPVKMFDAGLFQLEKALEIKLGTGDGKKEWAHVSYAVEAGPMLVVDGKKSIEMEVEGWKTTNSIKTQAARLDYTDMRGPKIAVGITEKGKLIVLMVNGRIRESVGATHHDMADILVKYGAHSAMGFDPGGSSTLVVNGECLNISPYNKDYEKNIYSLPPQPRFVSNAIMGWPVTN